MWCEPLRYRTFWQLHLPALQCPEALKPASLQAIRLSFLKEQTEQKLTAVQVLAAVQGLCCLNLGTGEISLAKGSLLQLLQSHASSHFQIIHLRNPILT
jgi:hypothetical protein